MNAFMHLSKKRPAIYANRLQQVLLNDKEAFIAERCVFCQHYLVAMSFISKSFDQHLPVTNSRPLAVS